MKKIVDNFKLYTDLPLDARTIYDTIADMYDAQIFPKNHQLYEGIIAYNKETDKMYQFKNTNDIDPVTGKWKVYSGGALEKDAIVKGTDIGGYKEGETIPEGTSFTDFVIKLVEGDKEVVPPKLKIEVIDDKPEYHVYDMDNFTPHQYQLKVTITNWDICNPKPTDYRYNVKYYNEGFENSSGSGFGSSATITGKETIIDVDASNIYPNADIGFVVSTNVLGTTGYIYEVSERLEYRTYQECYFGVLPEDNLSDVFGYYSEEDSFKAGKKISKFLNSADTTWEIPEDVHGYPFFYCRSRNWNPYSEKNKYKGISIIEDEHSNVYYSGYYYNDNKDKYAMKYIRNNDMYYWIFKEPVTLKKGFVFKTISFGERVRYEEAHSKEQN